MLEAWSSLPECHNETSVLPGSEGGRAREREGGDRGEVRGKRRRPFGPRWESFKVWDERKGPAGSVRVRVFVCCHLCARMSSHLCVCVVCVWFTGAGQVADSETNVVTPLWIA